MKKLVVGTVLLLLVPTLAWAGKSGPQYRGQGYAFFGVGTGAHRVCYSCGAVLNVGFGGDVFLYKGLAFGVEAGYAHWGPGSWNEAFMGSGDFSYHFRRRAAIGQADPFVEIGATGYFPTDYGRGAPAGNFGGGVDVWIARRVGVRLEVRDYINYVTDFPGTNSVSFRFGITFR